LLRTEPEGRLEQVVIASSLSDECDRGVVEVLRVGDRVGVGGVCVSFDVDVDRFVERTVGDVERVGFVVVGFDEGGGEVDRVGVGVGVGVGDLCDVQRHDSIITCSEPSRLDREARSDD